MCTNKTVTTSDNENAQCNLRSRWKQANTFGSAAEVDDELVAFPAEEISEVHGNDAAERMNVTRYSES